ncbi:MAG TPA: hypothetical protein DCG54_09765 [Anaerolineae bacterium]|jgi:hypothetical protein|nr:hypothetical protein [Anaerolineae bacterium]
MEIRSFWVDIEDAAGNKLGAGPLRADGWDQTARLSACGDFSFRASALDPNRAALAEKRVAVCRYIERDGTVDELGRGIIDKIVFSIDEDGALWLDVSGNDIGRELSYRSVGSLDLAGSGLGVNDAPDQIMAFAPAGWSITDGLTETNVYAGYDGESVLSALSKSGEHIGEHWRLGSGRVVNWLGPASGFAASGVRAVQHVNSVVESESVDDIAIILGLTEENDTADLLTRIIPRGSGNGSAIVTISAATDGAPSGYTLNKPGNYVMRNDAESQYGRIERALDFKEIGPLSNTDADVQAASNALLQASVEHLRRYGMPQKFYKVDLHTNTILQPGSTLRVIYRNMVDGVVYYDLDGEYNILDATRRIDGTGILTVGVTISTIDRLPQSDIEYLAGQMSQAQVLAAHQQLGASVDTLAWRDEMDDAHGASLRFWLGDEYTSVQRAILRFRIQPLRSTVKSVSAASTTSSSGGGGTSTSAAGGGLTADGGSHLHNTTIGSATPNAPDIGWFRSGGFITPVSASSPGDVFQAGVSATHDHPIPAHTHEVTIPDHTHEVTPTINMLYGIFEESSGNTLGLADLVIKLNGGSDLSAGVESLGGGWYALDITAGLVNSVYRPAQENNEVTFSTAVEKTARIEAQLTIRGVVQAVNYE